MVAVAMVTCWSFLMSRIGHTDCEISDQGEKEVGITDDDDDDNFDDNDSGKMTLMMLIMNRWMMKGMVLLCR